jgi:hypothetical protein
VHLLDYLKLLKGQVGKVSGSLLSRRPTCTYGRHEISYDGTTCEDDLQITYRGTTGPSS